jgi:hypothetical protein
VSIGEFHTQRIGACEGCVELFFWEISQLLPKKLAEESSATHPWEELSAPAWYWPPTHDRVPRARSWHRSRSRGLCLSSLTPQRWVRMIWSSLLEKQNGNNEVPLSSSTVRTTWSILFWVPSAFSRYFIVLNRFTLNPGRSISKARLAFQTYLRFRMREAASWEHQWPAWAQKQQFRLQ